MALALIGAFIAFWLAATGCLGRTVLVLVLLLVVVLYSDRIPWAWVAVGALAVIPIMIAALVRPPRRA